LSVRIAACSRRKTHCLACDRSKSFEVVRCDREAERIGVPSPTDEPDIVDPIAVVATGPAPHVREPRDQPRGSPAVGDGSTVVMGMVPRLSAAAWRALGPLMPSVSASFCSCSRQKMGTLHPPSSKDGVSVHEGS
jgi:hypothetical protein